MELGLKNGGILPVLAFHQNNKLDQLRQLNKLNLPKIPPPISRPPAYGPVP